MLGEDGEYERLLERVAEVEARNVRLWYWLKDAGSAARAVRGMGENLPNRIGVRNARIIEELAKGVTV